MLAAPPRGTTWLVDEFELLATLEALLFDETLTYGVVPDGGVETPFGVRLGATFTHRSLFGARERLEATAQFGGRLNQLYAIRFESGQRWGRFGLGARVGYEAIPRVLYYGLDEEMADVRTAAGRRTLSAEIEGRYALAERLVSRLQLRWANDAYGPPGRTDDPFVLAVYSVDPFTFEADDLDLVEVAFELVHDARVRADRFVPPSRPSSGFLVGGRLGAVQVAEADGPAFLRYALGFEQRLNLFAGTRILVFELRLLGTAGPIDRIPVFELPELGGPRHLRGYPRGRFRGAYATVLSVEYHYPLADFLAGFLFADAGRAFRTASELVEAAPEAGFGGGFDVALWDRALGRLQLGVSRRGGVEVSLGVSAGLDLDPWEDR